MAGLLSEHQGLVAWDSESTYGTNPLTDPPGTYYAVRNFKIEPKGETIDPDRKTGTQAGEPHEFIESHTEISGEIPLLGKDSAAGDPSHLDAILQAAGLKKTVNALTDVTYNFTTLTASMADAPSVSFEDRQRSFEDDTIRKCTARGARGNLDFIFEVNSEAYVSLDGWKGLYDEMAAAEATPALPTAYSSDKGPMIVREIELSVDGTTWEVEKMNLNTNWNVSTLNIGDPAGGNGSVGLVYLLRPKSGARPGGSITLVDGSSALDQIRQSSNIRSVFTLLVTITNGTDTITINSDGFQFGMYTQSGDNVIKYDVPFFLSRPAGTTGDDTEFSIVYT